ncbi:MAG: type II toxin-antitoxin system HicA family toxin [Candidatus Marinimicrobia bacterium]|nr:type II toxin-antitoxin system HicA family toxin [Candidatus Neomarinimicrobiota bacterium]
MPKLPRISGKEAISVFEKLGFEIARQKGSHVVMRKGKFGCVIPLHRNLAIGTLKNAIRQAGLNNDEFIEAYHR